MPEELWMEVQHCTGGDDPNHPIEKEMQKAKWLSEEGLQKAEKRREAKGKGEKETYIHLNAEFQRIARRSKKAFLREWERLKSSSRRLEISREDFIQGWAQ